MEAGSRGVDCSGLWAMTGCQGLAVVLEKSLCLCVWRVYGQETREGPGQSSWPLAMKCWSQKMLEKGTWGRGGSSEARSRPILEQITSFGWKRPGLFYL